MDKETKKLLVQFIEHGQNIDMFHHDMQFPGDRNEESKIKEERKLMQAIANKLATEEFGLDVHTFECEEFSYKDGMLEYTDEDVQEACQWLEG